MATTNIHAAKTNLSKLIEAAQRGEEVIIAKGGKPVVRLVPVGAPRPPRRATRGILKGKIWMAPDDEMAAVDREIERDFNAGPLLPK